MTPSTISKCAIILLGAPGAGKGTQAEKLANKFELHKIATSVILHEKVRTASHDPEVQQVKETMERGELVEPELVARWLIEEIKNLAQQDVSIIFDGSPRTLFEAEVEFPVLHEEYGERMFVFLIRISDDQTLFRNSHRRICTTCKHPLLYTEETKDLRTCPECAGELVQRPDDVPEVIKKRLEEYHTRTEPVIAFFREHWRVIDING